MSWESSRADRFAREEDKNVQPVYHVPAQPSTGSKSLKAAQLGSDSTLSLSGSWDRFKRDDPRIIAALEEYLEDLREGRPRSREEFLTRHSDIADTLSQCLAGLEFIHSAARQHGGSAPFSVDDSMDSMPPCARLGDYRILREIGRGGMGVVYEAEQVSLGRHVALKVLPFAAAIDPKQRQRFQIEAQAAAQLQHPHIVPIFSVGCDRGVHYYAMQFVEGRSLAAVVHELRHNDDDPAAQGELSAWKSLEETKPVPSASSGRRDISSSLDSRQANDRDPHPYSQTSPETTSASRTVSCLGGASLLSTGAGPIHSNRAFCRNVARLGVEAADALDHAHGLGILHRDIKPANLLIDPHGALWITDFGLARFPSDLSVTGTGDMVGTLRYMSPEQALARRGVVDQRTDIYSLGVTLYELLTLRPAFDGSDHQELLRQIAVEEPVPPRRFNSAVPRDLETIVLKAMAKDPSRRYATAQEMATDLRQFLDGRPILARRPGSVERTVRWALRHRDLVATTTAIVVLALILSTAALWTQARKTEVASRVLRVYIGETFPVADMITMGAMGQASKLLTSPNAGRESWDQAIQVYEQARKFYKTSSELPPTDVESCAIIAWANNRLGFTNAILSRSKGNKNGADLTLQIQAEADYRRSIDQFEKLSAEAPANPKVRRYFAKALGMWGWGWFFACTNRSEQAEQQFLRATQIWRDLIRNPGAQAKSGAEALTQENVSNVLRDLYSFADDVHTLAGLLEKKSRTQEANDLRRQLDEDVVFLSGRFSGSELDGQRRFWIRQFLREGTLSLRQEDRLNASLHFRLVTILDPDNAVGHNNLAWAMASYPGEAPFDAARAVTSAQKAVALEPANWMFWNTLGVAAFRAGDWKTAAESLQKSIRLNDGGGAADLFFLAMTRWHQGNQTDAHEFFKLAGEYLKRNPGDPELNQFQSEASTLLSRPCPQSQQEMSQPRKGGDVTGRAQRKVLSPENTQHAMPELHRLSALARAGDSLTGAPVLPVSLRRLGVIDALSPGPT